MQDTAYERGSFGEYRQYLSMIAGNNSGEHGRLVRNLGRALREELTERQLLMVTMYYLDGMKMPEIASELGVCISTVSRTLARGRKRLQRCLRYGARALLDEYGG